MTVQCRVLNVSVSGYHGHIARQASTAPRRYLSDEALRVHAVLHTHNRRLDCHPHVHIVVPGGGIDVRRRQFKKLTGRYLFNAFALARVFRAKLLRALHDAGVSIPVGLPTQWVVDCRTVGRGEPALKYLSRYLYRGVIRERDLLAYDANAGTVTFGYQDAQTGRAATRTLPMADFLWRVLLHVLPTGFRRVRD